MHQKRESVSELVCEECLCTFHWAKQVQKARANVSQALPKGNAHQSFAILSRYTVALHSVALRFLGFVGVLQENRATPPARAL